MKYVEMAYEMGGTIDSYDEDWIRRAHVVMGNTLEEIAVKKKEVEKNVPKDAGDSYFPVHLDSWEVLDGRNT